MISFIVHSTISFANFMTVEFGSQWEGTPFYPLSWKPIMPTDYEFIFMATLDPTRPREVAIIMSPGDFDQVFPFWSTGNVPPSYTSLQRPAL